jgi:chromosome segregation ATPase
MLEEYMKQLEAVIDKDEYDLSNFEEKILKREELLSKNNQQKNEEPEVNQSDEKLLYSEASTTNKVKSDKNLGNRPAWGSNTLHNKKNKVRESYKQSKTINSKNINNKVEEKKKKNLNLKKQREKIKQKHNDLEKELNTKEDELNKVTKEKEDLSKYLFKIEKVVKGTSSNSHGGPLVVTFSENDISPENVKNYEAFDSQSLTINISGGSPNIIMENEKGDKIIIISKKDLMKYLNKLYKENQGLKNFQNQIFNLSKSYDDINNNLADCIAGFQELCINNPSDKITMQDVDAKLDELKKHIENSLETKMNEYTILTDKRDEDLSLLKSEFIELEKEMKDSGSDRFEEQRKIMELQIKKEELERQIEELESKNENIKED